MGTHRWINRRLLLRLEVSANFEPLSSHSHAACARVAESKYRLHPWLVPSLALRETVAFFRAYGGLALKPHKGVRPLSEYGPLVGGETSTVSNSQVPKVSEYVWNNRLVS